MERSSTTVLAGKTSTVTVSLSQNTKLNNIYLRPGIINTSDHKSLNRATSAVDDSAEISIFDAEKYFNELNVLEPPKPPQPAVLLGVNGGNRVSPAENIAGPGAGANDLQRFSSASSSTIDGYSGYYRNYRTRSFRSAATPTASSEASWNSQTGLLSVQPGSLSVSLRNTLDEKKKARGGSSADSTAAITPSSFRWLSLRKKCPCLCKKSVQVSDKSVRRQQENSLPPQPPPPLPTQQSHMVLRPPAPSKIGGVNNGTISLDKVRHDSFQDSWFQSNNTRRTSQSSNLTREPSRSFSSASTLGMRPANSGNSNNSNAAAFSFPILNVSSAASATATTKLKENSPATAEADQDPARHSLEIFRPPHEKLSMRKNSDHHHHHHLSMISPSSDRTFPFPGSPNSRALADVIDDGASDASSDLFEIESFSTGTTATTATTVTGPPAMFLYRREPSEDLAVGGGGGGRVAAGGFHRGGRFGSLYDQQQHNNRRESLEEPMTPTTDCCYEPSEASIDWSVTTAEGFDRASVAYGASEADYGEFTEAPPVPVVVEKGRRRPSSGGGGLLMSCRCEKAVSVGRQPGPRPVKLAGSYGGESGRNVGPGMGVSSNSTLTTWAPGHKL